MLFVLFKKEFEFNNNDEESLFSELLNAVDSLSNILLCFFVSASKL